jgi:rod shape-determining protein MreC
MALSTPDSDQRDFRDTSPGLRLVLLCFFSIALMVLDNQNQTIQDVRRVLSAVVYPIQLIVDAPFAFGRWAGESLSTTTTLREKNEQLNRRILTQSARLQRMAALEAENARLRALLESTAKVGDRVLIAEIMSVDMNPFRHKIIVNKGSRHGVFVGQALIDAEGIVGQVIRDQIFSAEAILITDVDHALPVELVRNRLRTIAVGTGDLERLSMPFLPRNADVIEGDLLVSSGLGGTFPAGYPVGVVSEVISETGQPFLKISATPAAALNRIREVLLIWPEPGESAVTDEEELVADGSRETQSGDIQAETEIPTGDAPEDAQIEDVPVEPTDEIANNPEPLGQ